MSIWPIVQYHRRLGKQARIEELCLPWPGRPVRGQIPSSPLTRPNLIIIDDLERSPSMGTIKIAPVLNGWIVKVHCKTVVFTDKRLMMKEISRYRQPRSRGERVS